MKTSRSRGGRLAASCLVAVLVVAGCGDDDDASDGGGGETTAPEDSGSGTEGWVTGYVGTEPGGEPESGGRITMGVFSSASGLDPIVAGGGGYAGGHELAAIYDVLLRWDAESGQYEPLLAEGFESNEDFTQWTVQLRDGVTFTDGTPLDAAAVKFSVERFRDPDANSRELVEIIETIDTPDPLTVVFNLNDEYAGFPFVLAGMPGMIVSPAGVEAAGEDYAANPVGAGPFMLDRWAPDEELVLKRNPDYWGDEAYLDSLRFVNLQGAQTTFEALQSGDIQVGYLRDPLVTAEARDEGFHGYVNAVGAGDGIVINAAAGRPGEDTRVRQAIGLAIDPAAVAERAYGEVDPDNDNVLIAPTSPFSPGVGPITPDADAAGDLLAEATADGGYDGSLDFLCDSTPAREALSLTMQAQLNAVGFEVTINRVAGIGDLIGAVAEGDYDIACYGYSVDVANPYDAIYRNLKSDSAENRGAYANDDMDAAIEALRVAGSEDEMREALGAAQEAYNADPPFVSTDATAEFIAAGDDVRGLVGTSKSVILFHTAWVSG